MKSQLSALLILLAALSLARAEESPDRATLRGLKRVKVVVENIDSSSRIGLFKEQLKTDVELRLRRSRIQVTDDIGPYLYVNVNPLLLSNRDNVAYAIHVGLNQPVTLDRDKSISCVGQTWNTDMVGITTTRDFATDARRIVGDFVDQFINDYLAANP